MESVQQTHRPTTFKLGNKQHKQGKHRGKRAINALSKGKVNSVKLLTKSMKISTKKEVRRNQSNQIRQKKRAEILDKKRKLGTISSAPFLISIVPLSTTVNVNHLLTSLKEVDPDSIITSSEEGYLHICIPRFKQRFSFIIPTAGDLFANLDALKISDTVIFVMSAIEEEVIDDFGHDLLTAICAQGLPSSLSILTELESVPIKQRNNFKESVQKYIQKWIPEEKLINLEKISDGLTIFRKIGSQKQRSIFFRDKRPHLVAEEAHFDNDILKVTGFIRGEALSVNSLVHIPGWGNFQLSEIHAAEDKYGVVSREKNRDSTLLAKADPELQESLESELIPDPMDAEQTWPTEDELKMAEHQNKKKKPVPKGMSEYQAAWIPDDEESEEDDFDDEEEEMDICEKAIDEESDEHSNDGQEYDAVTETDVFQNDDRYDEKVDYDEEEELHKKLLEANTDAKWPDEVDTPQDIPARDRFVRYRGLESFRTSAWDPKENLPLDYARIFQFENFDRVRRKILKRPQNEGVLPGSYVTIYIKDVPKHLFDSRPKGQPLVVFGMLSHEQRMSVVNIVLKRSLGDQFQQPIRSKEQIIFHCGYRRFKAAPIFSQHTNGNKHKFERYFQPDSTVVATMFAPITFPPCNVLAFQQKENGKHKLIATGSVLSANPNRIICKRVVLSGHPFKVHKRSAVIRFMFFTKEDIEYYKKVELKTRYGRVGHIKDSLGTHGHMKCTFDAQLRSQDTVFLYLYKRVFPKWTYEPYVTRPLNMYSDLMSM